MIIDACKRKKAFNLKRKMKIAYGLCTCFARKIQYDHVSSFAGHAALFLLTSLFPMAMYCIGLFSYLPIDANQFIQNVLRVIPEEFTPLIRQIFEEAYAGNASSITMIVMLFCASKGVYAVIIGMNAVYGIRETRSSVFLYALAILYIVAFFSAIVLVMVLIVLGNHLFGWLLHFAPGLEAFDRAFRYGKYVCMLFFLVAFLLLVYMNIPNRKSRIRYEFPGALFSTTVWLTFSWAFSYYIGNFAHYSVIYGSLATIVIFILWLYGTMTIIFVGAEINVVLRRFTEDGYEYRRTLAYYREQYQGGMSYPNGIIIQFRRARKKRKKKKGE